MFQRVSEKVGNGHGTTTLLQCRVWLVCESFIFRIEELEWVVVNVRTILFSELVIITHQTAITLLTNAFCFNEML